MIVLALVFQFVFLTVLLISKIKGWNTLYGQTLEMGFVLIIVIFMLVGRFEGIAFALLAVVGYACAYLGAKLWSLFRQNFYRVRDS